MPHTDPERDPKSSIHRDKEQNPFIRFKRFADTQIGTVLQGIIGLPSVLSKQPSDANSRWADVSDDLKRRDRLLAEQGTSQDSGWTNGHADSEDEGTEIPMKKHPSWDGSNPSSGDEEVDIPVKKFPSWSLPAYTQSETEKGPGVYGLSQQDVVDFFSPVTQSLFANVRRRLKDDQEWSKQRRVPEMPWNFHEICRNSQNIFYLSDDQKMGNALDMIRSMVYNNINRTVTYGDCSQFHGSQSVLPYLLFSPYSPLALSSMPPLSTRTSAFGHQDGFTWGDAFEDLLLASQGRPMAKWVIVPPDRNPHELSDTAKEYLKSELFKARSGMSWIDHLHKYGLLSKDPPVMISSMGLAPICVKIAKLNADSTESRLTIQKLQDTEQDAYDFLGRIVDNVLPPFPLGKAIQELDSTIHDALSYIEEQEDITVDKRLIFPGQGSGNVAAPTDVSRLDRKAETQREPIPSPSDRVVCTTTSTEQTTDETGCVYTTVRIEKVYADGRVSITETSKTEVAPTDMRDMQRVDAPEETVYREEGELKTKKNKRSKGWFWN